MAQGRNFSIVASRDPRVRYDVLGMRERGRNIETAEAPFTPGWLGNPDRANDAGGQLTREQATALFAGRIAEKAKDPQWYDAFQSLRGKKIGYYKPDEEFIHLQALDDWLDANPPRQQKTEPFKLIIAGGRDFQDYDRLKAAVERQLYNANIPISPESLTVISGLAKGADTLGMQWAKEVGVPVLEFPAPWGDVRGRKPHEVGVRRDGTSYWKGAGHARNRQMAEAGDAVILFPGGRGTENMARTAGELGLQIWDERLLTEPMVPQEMIEEAVAELRGVTAPAVALAAEDAAFGVNPLVVGGGGTAALLAGYLLLQEQEKKEQQKQLELQLNQPQQL